LSFGSEGGETIVKAQAPVQASATSNAEWCQVTVGERSGDISVSPVTVTVSPNTTTYERSAVITITAGSESATVTVTQSEGEADVPTGEITATANEIAKKMYPGWNLGNTMEASGDGLACETAWQPTMTTQAVIDAVAAAGFKSVRIPCSWNIHTKDGSIDA
jgi:endoglucanase